MPEGFHIRRGNEGKGWMRVELKKGVQWAEIHNIVKLNKNSAFRISQTGSS
jgi:hypothetical protein